MRNRIGVLIAFASLIGLGFGAAVLLEHHLARNGVAQRWDQAAERIEQRRNEPLVSPEIDGKGAAELDADSKLTWERENWYYDYSNAVRVGAGPELSASQMYPSLLPVSDNAFRVLVVGDSFVAGSAVVDIDALWWKQLQLELDKQRGPGLFEVSAIGKPGASTMEEAEWLTEELLEEYRPDVILLGYLSNDIVPSFREYAVCRGIVGCTGANPASHPRYQACLRGEEGLIGRVFHTILSDRFPNITDRLLERYCDLDRVAGELGQRPQRELELRPSLSPYFPLWLDALDRFASIDEDIPVVVIPYGTTDGNEARGFIEDAGLHVAPMPATAQRHQEFAEAGAQALLETNPGDRHPGAPLTSAFAQDAASSVLALYDRSAHDASNVTALPAPLLSNFLPVTATVSSSAEEANFELGENLDWKSNNMVFPTVAAPKQTVPCAVLGRPHARLMLNPTLKNGTRVLLQHRAGPVLQVRGVGYDPVTKIGTQLDLGVLRPGSTLTLIAGDQLRGVLISSDPNGTCSVDKAPELDRFTVALIKS